MNAMQKHKFNIFPEMDEDEYVKLCSNIAEFGFDASQPVVVYQGAVLDGWNRFRAATELDAPFVERNFIGSDLDAINFVIRTNARRNLTSQQRAAIAAEAETVIVAIRESVEATRRANQAATQRIDVMTLSGEKVPSIASDDNRPSREIIAEQFGTNAKYFQKAEKLRKENPEAFEAVKSGQITFQQVEQTQKELIESIRPVEPEVKKHKDQDDFTSAVKKTAIQIEGALNNAKQHISDLATVLTAHGLDIKGFAPELREYDFVFAGYEKELQGLKSLIKCPDTSEDCEKCGGREYAVNG